MKGYVKRTFYTDCQLQYVNGFIKKSTCRKNNPDTKISMALVFPYAQFAPVMCFSFKNVIELPSIKT